MSKPKVLVADPIAQRGIDELANGGALDVTVKIGLKPDELLAIIGEFNALVVRSETKATAKTPVRNTPTKSPTSSPPKDPDPTQAPPPAPTTPAPDKCGLLALLGCK